MLYCNAGAAAFQYGGGMVENDVCETEELLLGPLLLVWLRRGFRGRDAAVHGMPRQAYAGIGGGGSGGDRLLNAQEMKEAALMKIVIVKSPKLFGGIIRRLFGIKKESYIE